MAVKEPICMPPCMRPQPLHCAPYLHGVLERWLLSLLHLHAVFAVLASQLPATSALQQLCPFL
jgi:hypothetical protein